MRKLICLAALVLCISFLFSQVSATADIFSNEIINRLSGSSEDMSALATAKYQEANYEEAIRLYLAHLANLPGDASALYNLACCYGLLGKERLAAGIVQLAYKAGFEDIGHINNDPDFKLVRESREFVVAMDSIRVWSARKEAAAGEQKYYKIDTYLPYRIYFPANYQPGMRCDLLVGLHGYGDDAEAFGGISRIIKDKPLIYIVPEAPYVMDMGTEIGYSWTPSMDFEDPLQESSFMGLNEAIVRLVRDVQNSYSIDKTILFGFSQGCFMTYNIGLGNPDVFDALLAFGGWLMPEIVGEANLNEAHNLKIYIGHGTQDTIVNYSSGEEAFNLLRSKDYEVKLGSFEGAHRIDRATFLAGLNWLMQD